MRLGSRSRPRAPNPRTREADRAGARASNGERIAAPIRSRRSTDKDLGEGIGEPRARTARRGRDTGRTGGAPLASCRHQPGRRARRRRPRQPSRDPAEPSATELRDQRTTRGPDTCTVIAESSRHEAVPGPAAVDGRRRSKPTDRECRPSPGRCWPSRSTVDDRRRVPIPVGGRVLMPALRLGREPLLTPFRQRGLWQTSLIAADLHSTHVPLPLLLPSARNRGGSTAGPRRGGTSDDVPHARRSDVPRQQCA